jgi:hypothetical protein
MNIRALLTGVAALLMATSAAHADEKWEGDFRKCQLTKRYLEGNGISKPLEGITSGKVWIDGDRAIVAIGPDEISDLEKGIALLKKCNKFWQCVADRGLPGKAKHCYPPRKLP